MRRSSRLTAAAVACAALGTGSVVFILTVANAVLWRPPPFADAERLVRIWIGAAGTSQRGDLSYLDAGDLRSRARSFDAFEMAVRTRLALTTGDGTERIRGESVTPGYFDLVRTRPELGRTFTTAEYLPGAPPVVLIGYGLWQRKFGGRLDIVGQTIRARGGFGPETDRALTVVGVLPRGFVGTVDSDVSEIWLPVEQYAPRSVLERRTSRATWVLARLKPSVESRSATSEVERIGRELSRLYPDAYRDLAFTVEPVGESFRARFRDGIMLLGGVAVFLLLIACTNITHLLLARLADREHELLVRIALGSSRGALVRCLFGESAVIAVLGGVAGVAGAAIALRFFEGSGAFVLPPYVTFGMDLRIVAGAAGLVGIVTVFAGALPAWLGGRLDAAGDLREFGRSRTQGVRHRRTTNLVVTAEVAFSFLLLVGSMLMLRTYVNLTRADPGYRTSNLLRLAVSLDMSQFGDRERILGFARDVATMYREHPGVLDASVVAGVLPPWVNDPVTILANGQPVAGLTDVTRHVVDDHFFSVMDIGVVAGRGIAAADLATSRAVAVVSPAVARALAGGDGRAAIGRSYDMATGRQGAIPTVTEIVGIVEPVRYEGPLGRRISERDVYVPLPQGVSDVLSIAVHTRGDAAALRDELVGLLGRRAPTSPLHWISTMEEELSLQFRDARLYAWLTGVFGACAIVLVLVGVYAVIANAVARRVAEIGIRMAVGATPSRIVALVFRQVAAPVAGGLTAGLLLAIVGARFATALVFGLEATDPMTFATVATAIVVASLIAGALPARRAARVDPVRLLGGR